MTELTERQAEVLQFITEHIASCGYPPTVREIATQFKFGSTNAVFGHLDALEKKGAISRAPRLSRSIRVLAP